MKTLSKAFFALFFFPMTLSAQAPNQANRTVALQQGILAGVDVSAQNAVADSILKPVLDGMIADSIIYKWGILTHNWGDEWNWNWWMSANDMHGITAAWDTVVARVSTRTPGGLNLIYSNMDAHKDNLYTVTRYKGRDLKEGEPPARFMMMNQSQVSNMQGFSALADSTSNPILDELVDEGLIVDWGIAQHAWADEWNWNWWMSTTDHAAFVTAWRAFIKRVGEAHPSFISDASAYVKRHRDNLYTIH